MKQLFTTGFIQVYFVAINTYFIAKGMFIGVLIASFAISLIWSFNVKKIAFGTLRERIVYSLGASIGAVSGVATSKNVIQIIEKVNIVN